MAKLKVQGGVSAMRAHYSGVGKAAQGARLARAGFAMEKLLPNDQALSAQGLRVSIGVGGLGQRADCLVASGGGLPREPRAVPLSVANKPG